MKNVFENAYFGKPYKTRDGRKAILISYNQRKSDTPYVCAVACYLDGSIKSVCHNFYANGQLFRTESNYDIVSEWCEISDNRMLLDLSCTMFPCDGETDEKSYHRGFSIGFNTAIKCYEEGT